MRTQPICFGLAKPARGDAYESSEEVDYQNMINLLDVLQQSDITKVGLVPEAAR